MTVREATLPESSNFALRIPQDGWLGLLLWIPTLQSIPQAIFGAALICALLRLPKTPRVPTIDVIFLCLIMAASSLNYIYGMAAAPDGSVDRSPYFAAYIATYLIARVVTRTDLRVAIYLIAVEALFVYLEFALRVNTIFTFNPEYRHLSIAALYFTRPFGLSDASSVIGYKLFMALLLLDFTEVAGRKRRLLQLVLLPAFVLVFNRTALVAYAIYLACRWLIDRVQRGPKVRDVVVALIGGVALYYTYARVSDIIWSQFNRGKGSLDLSYRDVIWANFLDFYQKVPLLGNGSSKYYAYLPDYGTFEHAHNSYLELLASNGIIISAIYLAWFVLRAKWERIIYIFPIAIYSFTQYGFFWGISFVDVLFLSITIFDLSAAKSRPVHATSEVIR
ncbi:MAG: O-antigen ligase family protein [Pseudomonadota bacterium]